jgi:hypothetical protein
MVKCDVCACETDEKQMKRVTVRGKIKKICQECVTAIKGLA